MSLAQAETLTDLLLTCMRAHTVHRSGTAYEGFPEQVSFLHWTSCKRQVVWLLENIFGCLTEWRRLKQWGGQVHFSTKQNSSGALAQRQQLQKTRWVIHLTQSLYVHNSPVHCLISTHCPGWICRVKARIISNDMLELFNHLKPLPTVCQLLLWGKIFNQPWS